MCDSGKESSLVLAKDGYSACQNIKTYKIETFIILKCQPKHNINFSNMQEESRSKNPSTRKRL